ncbi:DUF6141 family protein [Lentibacillus sediminis]|uniref:DUF6141 family protein n=1 Tax=Lentibacillus sediminis TaxID=1940529 RepID=UPI000C1C65CB|nr:DUF6141 family protein [Lentibacillus sediminis]
MEKEADVLYREVQRFRQVWIWVLVMLEAAIFWYGFIQQIVFGIPFGNKPAPDAIMVFLWLLFGIGFPVLMLWVTKLVTEVRRDGLYIRFTPFHRRWRIFLYKDIREDKVITYSPLGRFGGWGLRINMHGETAYTMSGKQGIRLRLKYEKIVVGSENPDELKEAMDATREAEYDES